MDCDPNRGDFTYPEYFVKIFQHRILGDTSGVKYSLSTQPKVMSDAVLEEGNGNVVSMFQCLHVTTHPLIESMSSQVRTHDPELMAAAKVCGAAEA